MIWFMTIHLVQFASASIVETDSRAVGANIAGQLNRDDLKAVLVLSDGLGINGSELAEGMLANLPSHVIVTGGLAGDGADFQQTWTLVEGKPTTGMVTAVGFYGNAVQIGYGSKGGWDLFGPERMVTKSVSNIVYELDNKPALALYKEYLGELAAGLPATGLLFPLALKTPNNEEPIVRTLLAVDEASQSLVFAGDVPVGRVTQLMRANFDRLIEGAARQLIGQAIKALEAQIAQRAPVVAEVAEVPAVADAPAAPDAPAALDAPAAPAAPASEPVRRSVVLSESEQLKPETLVAGLVGEWLNSTAGKVALVVIGAVIGYLLGRGR